MIIEKAKQTLLQDICDLVQTSIREVCVADHLNQQHHIDAWLTDRSVERLEAMLFNNQSQTFVCMDNEFLAGVSHISTSGRLGLCYVHPDYLGQGIGRLLLETAEIQARAWGCLEIHLISTTTAKEFYLAHGYEQYEEAIIHIGMPGYPLRKILSP